ncbi:MAG: hypothetical protein R6X20_13905 [Phycisphaerae bacterium]
MEPEPFATPVRDMLPVLVWGAVGLVLVFLVLALVRLWGWKTQRRGGSCGGIDLDDLRAQLIAGEISREEYEAVRAQIAGKKVDRPPAGPDGETEDESPIETDGADPPEDETGDDAPERSRTDGET